MEEFVLFSHKLLGFAFVTIGLCRSYKEHKSGAL